MAENNTPTKSAEYIEEVKWHFTSKWGLNFPARDAICSPSRRDHHSIEEKIHGHLNFLSFKNRDAIREAVQQFESGAPKVISEWQFKPFAEHDVLPSRNPSESNIWSDFLRRRPALDEDTARQLMIFLEQLLLSQTSKIKGQKIREFSDGCASAVGNITMVSPAAESQEEATSSLPLRSQPKSLDPAFQPAHHLSSNTNDGFPIATGGDSLISSMHALNRAGQNDGQLAEVAKITIPFHSRSSSHSSSASSYATPPQSPSRSSGSAARSQRPFLELTDNRGLELFSKFIDPDILAKRSIQPEENDQRPRKMSKTSPLQVNNTGAYYPSVANTSPRKTASKHPWRNSNDSHASKTSPFISSQARAPLAPSMVSSFTSDSSLTTTSTRTSFSTVSPATSFESRPTDANPTLRPIAAHCQQIPVPVQPYKREMADGTDSGHQKKTSNMHLHEIRNPGNPNKLSDSFSLAETLPVHDGQEMEMSVENRKVPATNIKMLARLRANSPFDSYDWHDRIGLSLRQKYEVARLAAHCTLGVNAFSSSLKEPIDDYDELWSSMTRVASSNGRGLPERSSPKAWCEIIDSSPNVCLSGQLRFSTDKSKPDRVFDLTLSPLRMERSNRFTRKFGSDRFLLLSIPPIGPENIIGNMGSPMSPSVADFVDWLVQTEHKFLGRCWRAFFIKAESSKKGQKGLRTDRDPFPFRVWLFAEHGENLQPIDNTLSKEKGSMMPLRSPMTVAQLIDWFMPAHQNMQQSYLKFFARLALGMTKTTATITFEPDEILLRDDAVSDFPSEWKIDLARSDDKKTGRNTFTPKSPVMNDGCSRLSKKAAIRIATILKLDVVPSVFQGRIGGAKGMWMVDTLGEECSASRRGYWIEITDSQSKFVGHSCDAGKAFDPARLTLDVSEFSKPLAPSWLNKQILPILLNRGVPRETFSLLFKEDLEARIEQVQEAAEDAISLRRWAQTTNPLRGERLANGGIKMIGGVPDSEAERINFLIDQGFEPQKLPYIADLVKKLMRNSCERLGEKVNIRVEESTIAYIIADPLAILEEDEVHIGFSEPFRDSKSGVAHTMLHNREAVIARNPAHSPSDVQKVRLVFKVELHEYKDVLVFSSKGKMPLAGKLSGGDYDGDRAWICWDERIVRPFQNYDHIPDCPDPTSFGIEFDKRKVKDVLNSPQEMSNFIKLAFNFSLRPGMLGKCSSYYENMCYHRNDIGSAVAIRTSFLLAILVDAAKSGAFFGQPEWEAHLRGEGLPLFFSNPAYKTPEIRPLRIKHFMDDLVFNVGKQARDQALSRIHRSFPETSHWDEDLGEIRKQELDDSKKDPWLQKAISNLEQELGRIYDFWKRHARSPDGDINHYSPPKRSRKAVGVRHNDAGLSFSSTVEKCRGDFLAIAPLSLEMVEECASQSTLVSRWIREHHTGQRSYWNLVKASFAFHRFRSTHFVWYLCGLELGEIKATRQGRGTYRMVVQNVYNVTKLDTRMIDMIKGRNGLNAMDDDEDEIDAADGAESEYGEWPDMEDYDF